MLHPSFHAYDSWFYDIYDCRKLPNLVFNRFFPLQRKMNPLKMYFLLKMRVFQFTIDTLSVIRLVPHQGHHYWAAAHAELWWWEQGEDVMKNLRPGWFPGSNMNQNDNFQPWMVRFLKHVHPKFPELPLVSSKHIVDGRNPAPLWDV